MIVRFVPAFCLAAAALLAGAPVALAGGVGSIAQVPTTSAVAGHIGPASVNTSVSTAMPFSDGVGAISGTGMNVSNSDGVTVQTNIDSSRNVQASNNVTVNETINGVQVGYGLGGDFLSNADAQGQAALAQKQADIQQLQNEVELMVQLWPGN